MRRKDYCFAAGGALREPPPEHVKKELSFMQKKGAPPSMIKAEKKEHGLPFGKKAKRFDEGGHVNIDDDTRARARAAIMARLARQDAEGAGDASAADPVALPPVRRAPARPAARRASGELQGPPTPSNGQAFPTDVAGGQRRAAAEPRSSQEFPADVEGGQRRAASLVPPRPGLKERLETFKAAEADKAARKAKAREALSERLRASTPKTYMPDAPDMGYAKGGSIDGCAQRGKTKAR